MKAINKIEQNKAQYDLDRQTAKISACHQETFRNINFNWQRCFTREGLPWKSWCFKKIWIFNSSLGKELKAQTSAAEKQYQKLDKVFDSNKKGENQFIFWANLCLVCSKDFTFYKYHKINEFAKRSLNSKQNDLNEFKNKLETWWY